MPFEALRERPLAAGIAPRHVRRYLAELNDHLDDLIQVQRDAGYDTEDAEIRAPAHSPALLPCLGGLDVMCMLMKTADGSLSDFGDPKTWPIYQTKQLPPEDFYKIEQAYAEWHKDHPAPAR